MFKTSKTAIRAIAFCLLCFCFLSMRAQDRAPRFKVIAFYTGKNDQAHISFVHEANKWFPEMAAKYHFTYDSTNDWTNLNAAFLLNTRWCFF